MSNPCCPLQKEDEQEYAAVGIDNQMFSIEEMPLDDLSCETLQSNLERSDLHATIVPLSNPLPRECLDEESGAGAGVCSARPLPWVVGCCKHRHECQTEWCTPVVL